MAFYDRLKQARIRAGLTQAMVADFLGIAKSTYSGYETGHSEPSIQTIADLMNYFNVKPDFLWQDELNKDLKNDFFGYAQNANEKELLNSYRTLVPAAKENILMIVRIFNGNPAMTASYNA